MGVLTFTEPYFPSHTQPSSVCSVHEMSTSDRRQTNRTAGSCVRTVAHKHLCAELRREI